jgi:hypothetical protein
MIFAICIDAGAGQHGYLGFHTWGNPGAFAPYILTSNDALAKFIGFWSVLIQAGFSYQGTELVGIAAGETENPRKNVPAAIRKTFWRILVLLHRHDLLYRSPRPPRQSRSPFLSLRRNSITLRHLRKTRWRPGSAKLDQRSPPFRRSLRRKLKRLLRKPHPSRPRERRLSTRIHEAHNRQGRPLRRSCLHLRLRAPRIHESLHERRHRVHLAPKHHRHCGLHYLGLHQRMPHRIHAGPGRTQRLAGHPSLQSRLATLVRMVRIVLQRVDYPHQWLHGVHSMEHGEFLHGLYQCYSVRGHVYWA